MFDFKVREGMYAVFTGCLSHRGSPQEILITWILGLLFGYVSLHSSDLHDLGLAMVFLAVKPKAQAPEEKTDKLVFIKIKNFCASKDTTKK